MAHRLGLGSAQLSIARYQSIETEIGLVHWYGVVWREQLLRQSQADYRG
jgi:hypothetical protein